MISQICLLLCLSALDLVFENNNTSKIIYLVYLNHIHFNLHSLLMKIMCRNFDYTYKIWLIYPLTTTPLSEGYSKFILTKVYFKKAIFFGGVRVVDAVTIYNKNSVTALIYRIFVIVLLDIFPAFTF